MGELLLELFSEEIPARMQARAAEDLKRLASDRLAASGLTFTSARAFATPRRLALVVDGIPASQPDLREEKKGPRVGSPQAAIDGFLKSAGLASLDQCERRDTGKGVFHFVIIEKKGDATNSVLPGLLVDVVQNLPWPKSMRFADLTQRWVRPLHFILALYDGKGVAGALPMGGDRVLRFGMSTRGHPFMAPGEITVTSFADYQVKLLAAKVILDPAARRAEIQRQCEAAALAHGLKVKPDEGLLDEVTGLVEWPVALIGRIDGEYMALPPEILTTVMRAHQKYFALYNTSGALAPHFLVVANIETADGGKAIIAGNERVLRARLSDAKFFWDQDRKTRLADRVLALKGIIFHAKLGSMAEKVARVRALAERIALSIPGASPAQVALAADLAKADLVTGMVGELPELQGIVGRHYARLEGLQGPVADAIADHYRPLGPSDDCPRAPISVALALADKIDTLAGFFAIDEKPTGSKDPFALRRAGLGIIRLILENGLAVKLRPILEAALAAHGASPGGEEGAEAIVRGLLDFLGDRLKVALREQGTRHDLIAAVFAKDMDDLGLIVARARALQEFVGSESGLNLLIAYRRAHNIVRIETTKDRKAAKNENFTHDGAIAPSMLAEAQEKSLVRGLDEAEAWFAAHRIDDDLPGAITALSKLRAPVDAFFDKVTVNCDDVALRANRLRLLSKIARIIEHVADFSRIEG